jgi:hypothetical protein
VQPAEQAHQDRTATAIVVERDLALSIDRGQREVRGGITGAQGGKYHDESLLFLESIEERQHHQRVRVEPGALAHRLGLLHELLGPALVAQIEMGGGEAIIAGEQQLRLVGLLGERERFLVVRDRAGRIAVALVDLPEHDQRQREVVELPEAPVEIDGGVRRADALLVAAVGERAVGHRESRVQPRLEAEVADLLSRWFGVSYFLATT